MIRTMAIASPLFALVALGVACNAAPPPAPEDEVGTTSSALTDVSYCANEPVAFTFPTYSRVWVPPDPEEGIPKGYWAREPTGCAPATLPPVAPPGGYPVGSIPPEECSDFAGVVPPAALTGCTAGYGMPTGSGGSQYLFLCPKDAAWQVPASGGGNSYGLFSPSNPCIGAPADPAHWQFVLLVSQGLCSARMPCDDPGNCAGGCLNF